MMRSVVNYSLRLRVLVAALATGIVLVGVTQLRHAPVDMHPEFAPTYVEVQTEALGLSAAEVEQLITVPLEADLLNGVAWLEDIRSESIPGLSKIILVFEPGTKLYRARQVVQERLAQAAVALPSVSKPPQMLQPVSSTSRVMMLGLSSKSLSLIDIAQLMRWTIKPRLMGVEGVANVSTFGHRERQLQVQVDPERLAENEVSLLDVVETTGNALWVSPLTFLESSTPGSGGFIETPTQRLGVQHVSPIVSADDLAQVAISGRDDLTLGSVTEVVEDHQPLIGDALVNNGPGIVVVIEKLPNANTVEVTHGVKEAVEALKPALKGLEIDSSLFQPAEYVDSARSNIGKWLIAGLVLLILLLGFGFYHWRTALVGIATILASLITAALVLYLLGATFNSMVIAGLAVALGVVIDDAIVGCANVARRMRQPGDETIATRVLRATLEVRSSLVYATLFVLLPVVSVFFMGDIFGAFGRPLAISYGIALGSSMVMALVLTPALSALLLRTEAHRPLRESGLVSRLGGRYEGRLSRLIRSPRPVLIAIAVLALAGVVALPQLRRSELPALRERDFVVELEAAPGTSLPAMSRITSEVTSGLRSVPGVRQVGSHVGRAIAGDRIVNVNSSELWVSLEPDADYSRTIAAIKEEVAGHRNLDSDVLTYTQVRLNDVKSGADSPIVVRVFGNERDTLARQAEKVGAALDRVEGVENLRVELPVEEPTLEIEVDLERAREFGVKPGDVRRAGAFLLSGVEVGQLFYDQKIFEVVVWGAPETRENENDVRNLLIDRPSGGQIRLHQVADVRRVDSPDVIEREGAFRRIDVSASIAGRDRGAVAGDVKRAIGALDFPLEYRAELLGEYEEGLAAQNRLLGLGILAAVGMILLLQACFGSWRLGLLFFLALNVALVGGVLAAVAIGGVITIGASVGLLTVLSIAARNGIVLIRRYQQLERRDGEPVGAELVLKGARERVAPTLLTALGTAVVFAPVIVLGEQPGYEILHPMSIVIIGGLVTATIINLFVTPLLYLRFGSRKTNTELDMSRFEEELAIAEVPVGAPFPALPSQPMTSADSGTEA